MSRRGLVTFLVIWLMGYGAACAASIGDHDAIGYLIGMAVFMLPGLAALLDAPRDRPLELARAITLAFCSGLISVMTFGLLGGIGLGAEVMLGSWVVISAITMTVPHPRGALIAMVLFAVANGLGCTALVLQHVPEDHFALPVAWLMCSALWPVPLIVACFVRPPPTTPVVRVVD